jgi:hypothetical protein
MTNEERGGEKGAISNKSRAFVMDHWKDKLDAHKFSVRVKQQKLLWECRCLRCGRTLFITQTGDHLGSATKNECLGDD